MMQNVANLLEELVLRNVDCIMLLIKIIYFFDLSFSNNHKKLNLYFSFESWMSPSTPEKFMIIIWEIYTHF